MPRESFSLHPNYRITSIVAKNSLCALDIWGWRHMNRSQAHDTSDFRLWWPILSSEQGQGGVLKRNYVWNQSEVVYVRVSVVLVAHPALWKPRVGPWSSRPRVPGLHRSVFFRRPQRATENKQLTDQRQCSKSNS
jgi:hypothetical protein